MDEPRFTLKQHEYIHDVSYSVWDNETNKQVIFSTDKGALQALLQLLNDLHEKSKRAVG